MKLLALFFVLNAFINFKHSVITSTKISNSINIEIDGDSNMGSFKEKTLYNLSIDNNKMKNTVIEKFLPDIKNSKLLDIKLQSSNIKILKHEFVNNMTKDGVSSEKRILKITLKQLDQSEEKNYNQGEFTIEYSYKIQDIFETVHENIFLKDIYFGHNKHESSSVAQEESTFSVVLRNIPKSVKITGLDFSGEKIHISNRRINLPNFSKNDEKEITLYQFQFSNKKHKESVISFLHDYPTILSNYNNNLSMRRPAEAPIHPSPQQPIQHPQTTNSHSYIKPNGDKVTYSYYKSKKKKSSGAGDIWESIIGILFIVCLCFLCAQCCCSNSSNEQSNLQTDNKETGVHQGDFVYYCN
jgi:hypothetical protein